jgi:hypothetical protein
MRHDLGVTSTPEPPPPHWPEHLPVGALRVTRWSSRYDETVRFYQDIIGLPRIRQCSGLTTLYLHVVCELPAAAFKANETRPPPRRRRTPIRVERV